MADWTFRSPVMEDAQAVLDLQIRCDIADYGEADSDMVDLLHDWESMDLTQDAWMAFDAAGALAGYADVQRWGGGLRYMVFTDPAIDEPELSAALLARCEARGRALAPGHKVTSHIAHVNERARDVLLRAGFRVTRFHFQMRIRLDGPLPAPEWPAGLDVRTAVVGQDEPAVFELIEAAFARPGREPQTFEDWQAAMLRADLFDPTLWFLAFAGEKLAGACLCYRYPDNGWVRQLAVADAWRRHGLGSALLLHAFHEFKRRGENEVGLGVAGDNPNACALYEKIGMRRARQYDEYTRQIGAA